MGFQRAKWHSGLVYRQACPTCKMTVTYTDYNLDFRPWFADGYVDCPTCGTHLRHNERYALVKTVEAKEAPVKENKEEEVFSAAFCPNCGAKFGVGHCFCTRCGAKRS